MKNNFILKCGLLLAFLVVSSCKKTEKDMVCEVAQNFAEAYYNFDMREAKGYCCEELYGVMNFRHNNLKDRDLAYRKSVGKATIRVIDCSINYDDAVSYVDVEVTNLIRINYLEDSLSVIPCDTLELILAKGLDEIWRIRYAL